MKLFSILLLTACAASPVKPLLQQTIYPTIQTPEERAKYEGSGAKFAVSAQGNKSAEAAERIFRSGGNIVDAAIAASFVISVERPHSSGLGGGGFFLFHEAKTGKDYAVDFRERAPLLATRDMFLDKSGAVIPEKSTRGMMAVAVPGLVAGLTAIHTKFGKLPLAKLVAPAAELAEQGLVVYPRLAEAFAAKKDLLARFPTTRAIFLRPDGSTYQAGEILVQKDLGATLRYIGKNGFKAFYRGKIGQEILRQSKASGGILSQKDFDSYRVKWRKPLTGSFRGFTMLTMPPPSSGGIHVIEILNILEHDDLKALGALSAKSIHLTAAAMQLAFADRAEYPGDPDFVKIPVEKLISKEYAAKLRATIGTKARPSAEVKPGLGSRAESLETTHFSIMDAEGNSVASTQTINLHFGSGLVAGNTGILLNDEMDDFSAKPGVANAFGALGGDANAIAPRKTPLSSMSPTIILKEGRPVMTVGAPGGTRIITCVTQTILNYLAYGMPLYDAVAVARVHHQWNPDQIDIDAPGPGDRVLNELRQKGYKLNVEDDGVPCRVEAVVKEGNTFHGVADPRDLGAVRAF
jgi:gamma-glutamyltranspeptidase/glutathione hydrolase